jgi:hypothetical protein
MEFGFVADIVRHPKTADFTVISSDFRILTNSTTPKSNRDKALGRPQHQSLIGKATKIFLATHVADLGLFLTNSNLSTGHKYAKPRV